MKLLPQPPKKSLNKAYLRQRPLRSDIDSFKKNLAALLDKIDIIEKRPKDESEEHLKNDVRDFLRDTFYKETNAINTKDKKDLVIHNGKTTDDKVGVIIEAKRPSNLPEMLTAEKPNAKALHELVLYYLRERIEEKNIDIKYLVATNVNEWYIFEARWFEEHFYKKKAFVKQYEEWRDGKKVTKDTNLFYSQIAKPYIETLEVEIPCTYFNLNDYKKSLQKNDGEEDKKLIALFKILSPYHLLKVPFADDSNKLDDKFYKELLHIIGLEEAKDGSKFVIRRKQNDRSSGSLLENTIEQIKDELHKVDDIKSFGETTEEQTFNIALELCITWINRILFLKLLEGQLVTYHKGNIEYRFLNSDIIPDFDELAKLFHKVLAVNISERTPAIQAKFNRVPYLNSSLFDTTELEDQTIKISNLDHSLPLRIFKNTKLTEPKKNATELPALNYLFKFLDAYDFASEGAEDIQEDTKTLINASVLGKVFEKINGYKDGSIFTPGFITMYMCRQSIRLAVVQKFNKKKPDWNLKEFDDLHNKIDDSTEANAIINDLKICDPAVGSGHFLVSALNEIIAIKSELRILTDKNGKRLKEYNIEVLNDELIVTDEDGDIFQYNPNGKESQRVQETLFHEKQLLIENCLFGVDINPKSVLICRLRLWIELLKNAYYKTNGELETLPNIDINIKCGNSLLSRFPLNSDLTEAFKKQQFNLKTYKLTVETYRNSTDKKAKRELLDLIDKIKKEYSRTIFLKDPLRIKVSEARGLLELAKNNYDLFGKKISEKDKEIEVRRLTLLLEQRLRELEEAESGALYKNAFEWRFEFPEVLNNNGEFVGFDLVIGNPPYFSLSKDPNNKHYSKTFKTFNTAGDIYCLFYELGKNILKPNAALIYITSNKWLRATYGNQLRNYLLDHTLPFLFFDFSWYQVFDNASVDTNILGFINSSAKYSQIMGGIAEKDFEIDNIGEYIALNSAPFSVKHNSYWNVVSSDKSALKSKIESFGKPLEQWDFQVNRGIITGFNEAFQIDDTTKATLLSADPKNAEIITPLLRGRDIERYGYNFAKLYLINTYNGFVVTIKNTSNIKQQPDGTFLYKPDGEKSWSQAKRIEAGKGNQYRVNRIIVEQDYPTIFSYLKKFEAELSKREDQGNHWTNLRNCAYADQFQKEKLVWAETMRVHKTGNRNFPRFGYDNTGYLTDKTVFIGVGSHLRYLLAVLNSAMGRWLIMEYVTKLDTGGYMMQKVFLDKIPIVEPSPEIEKQIISCIDQILSEKKQNPAADTTALENQIDELVFDLYNLTPDERKLILAS